MTLRKVLGRRRAASLGVQVLKRSFKIAKEKYVRGTRMDMTHTRHQVEVSLE